MTTSTNSGARALDRADERLRQSEGLGGAMSSFWARVRAGEVSALPVVVGLVIIAVVFQSLNGVFLSSGNLVNLLLDACAIGMLSLGIVCVLLVGEIDLSVGSMSGFSGAVMAVLFVRHDWHWLVAIAVACVLASLIGLLYGVLRTRLGMPSFVATLAGLLSILGLQLAILGSAGSVNLPFDSPLVHFAQLAFVPPWLSYVLPVLAAGGMFLTGFETAQRRRKANLTARSMRGLILQAVALLAVLEVLCWYLNQDRGVGWMVVFFVGMVLVMNYAFTRTKWGRAVFAIGGNVDAARRAGIAVNKVYLSAFMLCSLFACIGGLLAAGRLASANLSSGTGTVNLSAIAAAVIGGTSLFGGRGSAYSALLGTLVIGAIASGLTLLNLDSSYRFIITGLVLAIAVAVDSLARRSRASHGRG